ncbi:hypothetical protein [Paenibacillus arenilitoris]|uniref:Tetratricopeptide repeat protein n=1 Tax=Paenibacillus arenilitoris TaxID=2772299 RepID=A0A927H683_9BACL|nr:hypothetical protein [Paenibacillus arenilitoris]MBD2868294.1 hypothetical protein [Paenibacillus arenilitoris]
MATASSIIIFPGCGWNELPAYYRNLFEKLTDRHSVYMVSKLAEPCSAPSEVNMLSLKQLEEMNGEAFVAVVMQPYWTPVAMAAGPKRLIAMPDAPREEDPALWAKCRKWLCGRADLIITDSEPYYLEQTFCAEHVFLLDGRDEISDLLALQAFFWTLDGFTPKPLARLQQRSQADRYERRLCERSESDEPLELQDLFAHAVYRYFIYDLERAKGALLSSFGLAVKEGKIDALRKYYRFLSAIEAKQGLTRQAVRSYSFTAITPEEKRIVRQMEEWLYHGKEGLAGAMLYRMNADFRQALERLDLIEPEPEALRLILDSGIKSGRLNKALEQLDASPAATETERKQFALLSGTVALLAGRRDEAARSFEEAGEAFHEELGNLADLAELEAAMQELTR